MDLSQCALCCSPTEIPLLLNCGHSCCTRCANETGMSQAMLDRNTKIDTAHIMCVWCGQVTLYKDLRKLLCGANNCLIEPKYTHPLFGHLCKKHFDMLPENLGQASCRRDMCTTHNKRLKYMCTACMRMVCPMCISLECIAHRQELVLLENAQDRTLTERTQARCRLVREQLETSRELNVGQQQALNQSHDWIEKCKKIMAGKFQPPPPPLPPEPPTRL